MDILFNQRKGLLKDKLVIVLTLVSTKEREEIHISLKDESVNPLDGKSLVLYRC